MDQIEQQPRVGGQAESPSMWRLGLLLATVLLLPAVAWCGSSVRTEYQRGHDSGSWPTTRGRVLSSKWEENTSCDSDGCYTDYDADISYEYLVGGRRYEATRYRFGWPDFGDKGDVQRIVAEYPAGADARVYYDPDSPALSALRPGLAKGGFILALLGLGALVVMLWFGAYAGITEGLKRIGLSRRRRSQDPHVLSREPDDDWEGPGRLGTPEDVYRSPANE